MTEDRRAWIKRVFVEAAELPADARTRFIEHECAHDTSARREVEDLLSRDAAVDDSFLAGSAATIAAPGVDRREVSAASLLAGDHFPGFSLRDVLGEGGMGIVFEAMQENPPRAVALKVIRDGRMAPEQRQRFQRECEVLARLQHANIAQIHASGTSEAGRPFFAMELIRGVSVTEHFRRNEGSIRDMLALMAHVCDAVHYAHSQGVIHRDLKPSNILVGATGRTLDSVPKIIDFGIAKLSVDVAAESGRLTMSQHFMGTPAYMSPEQVSGLPLDAGTDVYALGVILYELLSGRLPYNLDHCSLPEAARIIREEEPSRLISTGSQRLQRPTKTPPVGRVDRDVETIVLKCLEKEKHRRYRSAADLADDIRRYLRDEPILARPATSWYQIRKFAKRHKELVFGLALTFVALVIGLVMATRLAWQEQRQRIVANEKAADAQREAYRACIAAATAALQNHDVATARQSLTKAPESLRGWEWRYLNAQLDQSVRKFSFDRTSATYWWRTQVGFVSDDVVAACENLLDGGFAAWNVRTGAREPVEIQSAATNTDFATLSPRFLSEAWVTNDGKIWTRRFADNATFVVDPHIPRLAARFVSTFWVADDGQRVILALGGALGSGVIDCDMSQGDKHISSKNFYMGRAVPIGDKVGQVSSEISNAAIVWAKGDLDLVGHSGNIHAIAAPPDGKIAATGSRDTTIRVWNAESGMNIAIGRGHTDAIFALAFSDDGHFLASGGVDRTLRLWQVGDMVPLQTLHGHDATIWRIAYSPSGERVVTLDEAGMVRVWDCDRARVSGVLRGHTSFVYPVAVSPDGRWIASCGWDQTTRIWDASTLREVACLDGMLRRPDKLAFSSDGRMLLALGYEWADVQRLRCWSVGDWTPTLQYDIPDVRHELLVGTRGVLLLSHDGVQSCHVVPFDGGNAEQFFDLAPAAACAGLDVDPRAKIIAPFSEALDGDLYSTLGVLNVLTGAVEMSFEASWSNQWALSPVGNGHRQLAVPLSEQTPGVDVWDIDSHRKVAELRGHSAPVFGVAWSPDGERIATAGRDQVIRIWDARRFEEVAQLRGHTAYVWSLAWSPDGSFLVSASGDQTIRVWDARSRAIEAR